MAGTLLLRLVLTPGTTLGKELWASAKLGSFRRMASSTREQYLERVSTAGATRKRSDDMLLKLRALGTLPTCRPSHRIARNLAHVGLCSKGGDFGAWGWPARTHIAFTHSAGRKTLSKPTCTSIHSSTSQEAMASYEEYLNVALLAAKEAGEDLQPLRIPAACRIVFDDINIVIH